MLVPNKRRKVRSGFNDRPMARLLLHLEKFPTDELAWDTLWSRLPAHPVALVESPVIALVKMKASTHVPTEWICNGTASRDQIRTVQMAQDAWKEFNPDGSRRGLMVADGTGVGKNRTIVVTCLDVLAQTCFIKEHQCLGPVRVVIISQSQNLYESFVQEMEVVVKGPVDSECPYKVVRQQQFASKAEIVVHAGEPLRSASANVILYTTYSMLGSPRRLEQLHEWLKDAGRVVFFADEVQNVRNHSTGGAKAMLKLQHDHPSSSWMYLSATPFSKLSHLHYAKRLPLHWFPVLNDIKDEGLHPAMERLAPELKAAGCFIARTVSMAGTEVERWGINLTKQQQTIYEQTLRALQVLVTTMPENSFYSMVQRVVLSLIASFTVETILPKLRAQIKHGFALVVTLQEQGEASAKKAHQRKISMENFSPVREQIVAETQRHLDMIIADKPRKKPYLSGAMTLQERQARLEQLLDQLEKIAFPMGAIDLLHRSIPMSEISGRKHRMEWRNEAFQYGPRTELCPTYTQLKPGERIASSSPKYLNEVSLYHFEHGHSNAIVVTSCGQVGISLHPSENIVNQRPRLHVLLQFGWSPEQYLQSMGRTHRSGMAEGSYTRYIMPIPTSVPSCLRFSSAVHSKLSDFGAMVTGNREAYVNLSGDTEPMTVRNSMAKELVATVLAQAILSYLPHIQKQVREQPASSYRDEYDDRQARKTLNRPGRDSLLRDFVHALFPALVRFRSGSVPPTSFDHPVLPPVRGYHCPPSQYAATCAVFQEKMDDPTFSTKPPSKLVESFHTPLTPRPIRKVHDVRYLSQHAQDAVVTLQLLRRMPQCSTTWGRLSGDSFALILQFLPNFMFLPAPTNMANIFIHTGVVAHADLHKKFLSNVTDTTLMNGTLLMDLGTQRAVTGQYFALCSEEGKKFRQATRCELPDDTMTKPVNTGVADQAFPGSLPVTVHQFAYSKVDTRLNWTEALQKLRSCRSPLRGFYSTSNGQVCLVICPEGQPEMWKPRSRLYSYDVYQLGTPVTFATAQSLWKEQFDSLHKRLGPKLVKRYLVTGALLRHYKLLVDNGVRCRQVRWKVLGKEWLGMEMDREQKDKVCEALRQQYNNPAAVQQRLAATRWQPQASSQSSSQASSQSSSFAPLQLSFRSSFAPTLDDHERGDFVDLPLPSMFC